MTPSASRLQVLKRGVVFDGLAEAGTRVIANERFGLALAVRQNAVVAGIDGRVIEPGTDFRALAVVDEVHHVSFAPEVAFEHAPAEFLVHEIEQLDRARMHRDRARFAARARHAFDASILHAAARQLHREHAPTAPPPTISTGTSLVSGILVLPNSAAAAGADRDRRFSQNNSFTDSCSCRGLNIVLGVPKSGIRNRRPGGRTAADLHGLDGRLAASLYCRGCWPPQRL